jgi:hypothetical protein
VRRLFNLERLRARRADAAALAAIALFFVAFFPQGLFGGKYLLAGDAFFYSYPLRTVAWRMIRAGEWPTWTPYVMSGYPLLSMAQLGLGYPLTWGYLFLPGRIAEQLYMLAPFLLAPVFTYLYLRELKRSPLAALLGALAYGYGGMMCSPLANNGLLPNACMWLPLMLTACERARRRPFLRCLLLATFAYTMSVLTGVGQGFIYVAALAAAYALFLAFISDKRGARLSSLRAWRPFFIVCGAGLLATGVAAFQILETARAVRRSVRSVLSYELFTQGAFPPLKLWSAFITPLFNVIDTTPYVPPLAVALALVAVYAHARRKTERDPRVFFWLVVAIVACVLMMGASTPLYVLVYHLPLLNRFRVPSRHTFEWTFALGVLAAYGWDALAPTLDRLRAARTRTRLAPVIITLALLAAGIIVGMLWWQKTQQPSGLDGWPYTPFVYRAWKVAFVLIGLVALWRAALVAQRRWRFSLVLVSLLVVCYFEPALLITRWWMSFALPAARFTTPGEATRYLQQFAPTENRIYTRVDLMTEQFGDAPRFDGPNLSAVWGLHNVAGYEPLILERYSQALGGTGLDAVHALDGNRPDATLLTARSHVLDILNDTFLVSYPALATAPGGGNLDVMQSLGELPPGATKTFNVPPTDADELMLVTSLSNSTFEPDGTQVARLRVFAADGRTIELSLRAGDDTAEWAHERADVRALMKHRLAPIYDSTPISAGAQSYTAYRYRAQLPLGTHARVRRIEITNVSHTARLGIGGALLVDTHVPRRVAITPVDYSPAWQPVYEQESLLILRNTRAQPRAWLVAEAAPVRSEEALQLIRGDTTREFDPRRTALLEVRANELPDLPGGELAPGSTARIVSYEPSRLLIETDAPTATVLVVSEIFYPGWEATIDGQRAPILLTDYLLRGVVLPAGHHTVEMRYVAHAARTGAYVSALTLCLIAGLAIYARRVRGDKV